MNKEDLLLKLAKVHGEQSIIQKELGGASEYTEGVLDGLSYAINSTKNLSDNHEMSNNLIVWLSELGDVDFRKQIARIEEVKRYRK